MAPSVPRTTLLLGLPVALVLVLGAAVWRYRYLDSPGYALHEIEAAAREHNRLKFESYVDVDRFTAKAIDDVMNRVAMSSLRQSDGGAEVLGVAMGVGMVEKVKPALVAELRASLLHAVETGRFDSAFVSRRDTSSRDLTLAVVARNMAADRLEFAGLGDLRREGDAATVDLRLRHPILDTTLVLRVRLDHEKSHWRVVAPDNLPDYLEVIEGLQRTHLAAVNAKIRERLTAMVRVTPVGRSLREYEWANPDLILSASFTNRGRDTVAAVLFTVYVDGTPMDHREFAMGAVDPVAPGATVAIPRTLDYNEYIAWHRRLRFADSLRLEPWAIVTRRGAARDTIIEHPTWADYVARR